MHMLVLPRRSQTWRNVHGIDAPIIDVECDSRLKKKKSEHYLQLFSTTNLVKGVEKRTYMLIRYFNIA